MGQKAQNRGDEVIRRQYDRAEEVRAGRMIDRMNADMARLEEENEKLKSELAKAKDAYHRRTVERDGAIEEARENKAEAERTHALMLDMWKIIAETRWAHQKLSAIIRDNMTPEQYHIARANAAIDHPELFDRR